MSDEHNARTSSLEARLTSVKMEIDDDDEDADEDGNLDGFVVPDKSESDEEDNGRSIPPAVPVVKKRRT